MFENQFATHGMFSMPTQKQLDAFLDEAVPVKRRQIVDTIITLETTKEALDEAGETLDNIEELFRVFVPDAPVGTPHVELGHQALEQAFLDGSPVTVNVNAVKPLNLPAIGAVVTGVLLAAGLISAYLYGVYAGSSLPGL